MERKTYIIIFVDDSIQQHGSRNPRSNNQESDGEQSVQTELLSARELEMHDQEHRKKRTVEVAKDR